MLGVIANKKNIRKPSRQLKQIKDICKKIKDLVKAMKTCSDEHKYGALVCLMDKMKKRRRVLRYAEHSRKRR